MRITVVGTGYVGLVAGACFADTGNDVTCLDVDPSKIEALKRGEIPIYEPGLDSLVKRGVAEGRLKFTTSYPDAIPGAEIVFLAVGTPPLPNGDPDMKYVKLAAEQVADHLSGPVVVVNKSTVPIGTHKTVAEWIDARTKHDFDVVSNPEFLKEGTAVDDFLRPDRVVIGTDRREAYEKMAQLYAPFVRQGNPILWMDPYSAEITKYACNAFLATRISFMNELAHLCERTGGDVEEVRRGMASDQRIGRHFLYAGAGYGGSCFPKDVKALLSTGRKEGVTLGIVHAAEEANARQKRHLFDLVTRHFSGRMQGRTVALWGLAFKPNTDDMREAPSLTLIEELLKAGAKVRAFDPVATENARKILGNRIEFHTNAYEVLKGCDALLIVTEWNEFRNPDFQRIKSALSTPTIFDGRNLYNPAQIRQQGFHYTAIGRR